MSLMIQGAINMLSCRCSYGGYRSVDNKMAALLLTFVSVMLLPGAFTQDQVITFSIFEESPRFTFVGDIPAEAELKSKLNASVIENLKFSILQDPNNDFTIEEDTGVLRTNRKIDRDAICPAQVSCFIDLAISAHSPPDHLEVFKVKVEITDSNDNSPRFTEEIITRYIPENTRVGSSFSIPLAEDLDSPLFGVKEYRVLTGSVEFQLKVVNTTSGVSDLYLVLMQAVDREKRSLYKIVIAAIDGGAEAKTGALTVNIVIQDVNDNPPVFNNSTYSTYAREDAAPGTIILRVAATDLDSGTNGQVLYSFSSKTATDFGQMFSLDNVFGDLSVKGTLDYEKTKMYTLHVTAKDTNGEWLPSEAKVIVRIQDVNDNPPQISVSGLSTSRQVEISEASPKGSYIAYISVQDPDSQDNGLFDCTLNSDTFLLEPLSAGEFKLMTKVSLDREQVAEYRLPFSCTDKGQIPLTSTSSVQVTVLDENDNAPKFIKTSYTRAMAENNKIGDIITTVSASDPDSGKNGEVQYRVVLGSELARVLPDGSLVATAVYDYEKMKEFVVKVEAADGGSPNQSSIVDVRVLLSDVNDRAPLFLMAKYTFGVNENEEPGIDIGQVVAKDEDSPPFNDFSYSMKDTGPEMFKLFSIDGLTGKLTTRTSFDRETVPGYSIVVLATDVENPRFSSSVTVSIYVIDKNDNDPIFIYPTDFNNTVNISNITPVGETIAVVRAEDNLDSGENARVSYSISGGEDVFQVEPFTGVVQVRQLLRQFEAKMFHLRIMAKDNGSPPRHTEAVLKIVVSKSIPYTGEQTEPMGGHNVTIVVSVAIVTVVVVVVLVAAIVIILRWTKNDKMKKNHIKTLLTIQQNDHNNSMDGPYMEKNMPSSKSSKKDVSFSNDVDINDESPSSRYAENMYKQMQKGNYEAGKSGSYVSPPKKPCRQSAHSLGSHYPRDQGSQPSPRGIYYTEGDQQPQGWDHHGNHLQPYLQKEDNLSMNSQDSINTDSGRGSNEDAESRPSSMETEPRLYNTSIQGDHSAQYRRDSGSRGSSPFKQHLSNIIQMQKDHCEDLVSPSVDHPDNYRNGHPRDSSRDMHSSHLSNTQTATPNKGLHHVPLTNSFHSKPSPNPNNSHLEGQGRPRDASAMSASYV